MIDLIDRRQAIKTIENLPNCYNGFSDTYDKAYIIGALEELPPAASPWHRVEDGLPKESGEYIVAYHPCYWDDVKTKVTKVGIDNFRGKSAWAKKKFQRVTHWMEKPEPPKEDA